MNDDRAMEEGEIRRSPYSEEEGADTADSLDIKPPQAVIRHRKVISHRHDKHSDRSAERRDEKDRKRHRDYRDESRHKEKYSSSSRHHSGRHSDFSETMEQPSRRSDSSKRERESYRHERKERSTGDRVLEDLRESNFGHSDSSTNQSRVTSRLLDKREKRERRDEYKMEVSSSSRSRDELRLSSGSIDRREMERRELKMMAAMEEAVVSTRDRREVRLIEERSSRHVRLTEQDIVYQQGLEMMDEAERSPVREKRQKRSHKHERVRSRDEEKKHKHGIREKHSKEHRYQQVPEASLYEDLDRMEVMISEQHIAMKDPKDMNEQELRRHRLIEAEREMARRKESSRLELEARRMKRGEKRNHDDVSSSIDPSVVELSDESLHSPNSNVSNPKSHTSAASDQESGNNSDDDSSDSSSSSSMDEDDSDASKRSNEDSNSDYNNPSPLSQIQLAKSDVSNNESPLEHADTNGATKESKNDTEKSEMDLMLELPPYLPAIQGCRSVEEYKCLNRIAEGTYGVVYRAEDRRTKEIVALKRLKMEKEKDGFPITSLREINTLLKAQHPNIVTVREIVVGSNMDKIFIVMDYVEHDLKSLIETMKSKNQVFIPGEVKCLMQQLLQAVAHMHDNWILHRDLKTSNLLLSHRGILKVGDFGLAREYGSPLKQYTSIVVTLWYRAPELLLGSKTYSTPIDVWSVGCIFAELLRMEALFPGKSELDLLNRVFKELGTPNDRIWPGYSKLPMTKKVSFSQYPVNNIRQRFNLLTDLGIDLLNKFLTYDPEQRISAEDALKHGYFVESPVAIDPSMFPTWPAKSEFGARTVNQSPKPPSGGKEFKQKGDKEDEEDNVSGFHMGGRAASRQAVGGGFHLKF
ncbi:hypothetical protein TKK_0005937 [Trichogramma kaykai]|uniref:cyclin-dependent kinase n=1 Tax=Trichogramma kaykai TaxID=54128 RepID=A0ABD2XGR3_9HYME